MHPTCSLDGCLEDQAGELNLLINGATGGVRVELCARHAGAALALLADLSTVLADRRWLLDEPVEEEVPG